jgi:carbamoyltransferase
MRDYLNEHVKYREYYRPVAPIILEEEFEKYFSHKKSESLRLMNLISTATELAKEKAPSAVHVDGTARIQLVGEDEKELRALLVKFFEITGVPMLINTSFNLNDEPIVDSPRDAIRTFVRSNLRYLAIGNYLIEKTI